MSEHAVSAGNPGQEDQSPFDNLIGESAATAFDAGFTTTFRGYDKEEVDAAIAGLDARVRAANDEVAQLKELSRRGEVVLLDYTTNGDVADLRTPLSHAALIAAHLEDRWP